MPCCVSPWNWHSAASFDLFLALTLSIEAHATIGVPPDLQVQTACAHRLWVKPAIVLPQPNASS